MASPTSRSLKLLRDRGYLAEVVEKWIPGANIRKDLWGWCDVLCLSPDKEVAPLAVQVTTDSHVAERVAKIRDSQTYPTVNRLFVVCVHGWKKVKNRWKCREVIV